MILPSKTWISCTICCWLTIKSPVCNRTPFLDWKACKFCECTFPKIIRITLIYFVHLRDLEYNKIEYIHPETFTKLHVLEDLNLGNNVFPTLPHKGLHHLLHIKTFNNPNLREFPPVETFPRIKTLVLSYAYHCCPFMPMLETDDNEQVVTHLKEKVLFSSGTDLDSSMWNMSTDIWSQLRKYWNQPAKWELRFENHGQFVFS